MPNHNTGIYKITNTVNGKCYIGSAVSIRDRLNTHRSRLRRGCASRYFQNAWNKYGENAFKFEVILYCNKQDLLFYEQRAIDVFKSANRNGYNAAPKATSNLGIKLTEEHRGKISKALKGRQGNWNLGLKLSKEHRQKISEAGKNRRHTEEAKAKMSLIAKERIIAPETKTKISKTVKILWANGAYQNKRHARGASMLGKHHSDEAKEKISKAKKGQVAWNKGIPSSDEAKQKLSESHKGQRPWMLGRHHTEETKQKLREARKKQIPWMKGKHHTEETKKKISEALMGNIPGNKGKKCSEESRKKMSEAAKGRHPSLETRRKLSEINKGRPVPEERRRKISEAKKGKPCSEETKLIISLTKAAKRQASLGAT